MVNNNESILVIGSKNHPKAERCVSWGDKDFAIGDFDTVIINTKSLTAEVLTSVGFGYLGMIREQIMEAQIAKGVKIICVTSDFEAIDDYGQKSGTKYYSNYDWSPIIPIFKENSGKKIKTNLLMQSSYIKLLNGWDKVYDAYIDNTRYNTSENLRVRIRLNPFITTQTDTAVAFSIYWYTDGVKYNEFKRTDSLEPMLFLPEVTDIHKGINLLIEEQVGSEEDPEPDWLNKISLPGEPEILADIDSFRVKITELESQKTRKIEDLSKLGYYKKLLYLNKIPLQGVVKESFGLLGIKIDSPEATNLEDGFFQTEDGGKIYMEIRGKDTSGMIMKDLTQLIGRIGTEGEHNSKEYKTKGIYVLNHYRLELPTTRKKAFDSNLVDKAIPWNILLMTTYDLFQLVEAHLGGKKFDNLDKQIFNMEGVFEISKILN
jgi:hypothetical protein